MWKTIIKWLFPRISEWALRRAANVFRREYPPEVHAKLSRKYMWEHHYRGWRDRATASKNNVDDLASDFGYWYVAAYIEDGSLDAMLAAAAKSLETHNVANIPAALQAIRRARAMIGMPKCDGWDQ